jgi:hypothetical protein
MAKELLFENETCGRCQGSGNHSYNQRHGTVCYGCGGRGKRLTKRGAAANAFYNAKLTVTIGELVVGDKIRQSLGGDSYGTTAEVISIGELYQYGSTGTMKDGEWIYTPCMGIPVELRLSNGETMTSIAPPEKSVRKLWDRETIAAVTADALALQDTLTKSGTPKKSAA